ncbi:MAG: M14 family metallopeptidase [Planctomycetota bacterium]
MDGRNRASQNVGCGARSFMLLVAVFALGLTLPRTSETQEAPGPTQPHPPELTAPRVSIAWNRLYDEPEVSEILRRLHQEYPDRTRLEAIGTSEEGRSLWVLVVTGAGAASDRERPAMWVDGNVHGNEVQAAETCLYLAWYLLENSNRVPAITELLNRVSFYILPMVNPDGRAYWFRAPNTDSSSRSGKRPTDNDGDGVCDEDGYDDLDGDGEILQMRKRDPLGRWRASPEDARLLVRAKPDERGEWTLLGSEGIDNDGDGRVNEDGPGGYDMNRNWPSLWMPNYVQFGAGEYPFSFPETRAVGDFILDHPNIAAVQSFHNAGGMILRGPGAESFGEYPPADVRVYDELGKTGESLLPFYRYMVLWKDLYTVYGGFVTWTYEGLGIFSLTNELWTEKRRAARTQDLSPKERLDFNDLLRSGVDYRDWRPATHPVYGEIEIGGWRKAAGRTPPSFLIEEELHRNALFCIYHAGQMPELAFEEVTVTPLPTGQHQIDVTITNRRPIPSISAMARSNRIGLPDRLELLGKGVEIRFAATVEDRFPERLAPIATELHRILNRAGVERTQPYQVRYLVSGRGKVELTYHSQKAATIRHEVVLE